VTDLCSSSVKLYERFSTPLFIRTTNVVYLRSLPKASKCRVPEEAKPSVVENQHCRDCVIVLHMFQ
jgi:hypothetical protein